MIQEMGEGGRSRERNWGKGGCHRRLNQVHISTQASNRGKGAQGKSASLSSLPTRKGGSCQHVAKESAGCPPGKGGRGILANSSCFPKAVSFFWHGGRNDGG